MFCLNWEISGGLLVNHIFYFSSLKLWCPVLVLEGPCPAGFSCFSVLQQVFNKAGNRKQRTIYSMQDSGPAGPGLDPATRDYPVGGKLTDNSLSMSYVSHGLLKKTLGNPEVNQKKLVPAQVVLPPPHKPTGHYLKSKTKICLRRWLLLTGAVLLLQLCVQLFIFLMHFLRHTYFMRNIKVMFVCRGMGGA